MSLIKTAETTIKGWLKPVPTLPSDARKWLGENVWWIATIGVVALIIGTLMGIQGYTRSMATLNAFGINYGYGLGLNVLVSVLFSAVTAILLATAVQNLRAKKKLGWDRLFLVVLVEAAFVVVNAVLTFDVIEFIFTLLIGAIGLAVGAYLTLEIKSEFEPHVKKAKKLAKK